VHHSQGLPPAGDPIAFLTQLLQPDKAADQRKDHEEEKSEIASAFRASGSLSRDRKRAVAERFPSIVYNAKLCSFFIPRAFLR
jgi:hypothetical protein